MNYSSEKGWREESFADYKNNNLSELISPDFSRLIEETTSIQEKQALKSQVFFDEKEMEASCDENADPLGEANHAVSSILVHQYKNRILLLATGKCFAHCRYCFRKSYTARPKGFITDEELKNVISYLKENPNVKEVLISGGDPLTASFEELKCLLLTLRKNFPSLIFRLCTRAPIFAPSIFSNNLLLLLEEVKPLWLIPHINHSAELGLSQRLCLENILKNAIPMQSQTVLLKGINDNVKTLVSLFNNLTMLGIKPGYLFQLDMAFGTSHFRVPLKKALILWEEVKEELSGLSTPTFAVDLPLGGGKFPLSAVSLQKKFTYDGNNTINVRKKNNKVYTYSTKNDKNYN
ncbi:MAG: KamA family radical SAM protein [Treponema sp.]